MSKKKNTLKDLDEFLKQQAATLVTPSKLSEKIEAQPEEPEPEPEPVAPPPPAARESYPREEKVNRPHNLQSIVDDIRALAEAEGKRFKPQLYDALLRAFDQQDSFSTEDKMLINTLLYLKHGENWKAAIREFWKSRPNQ